MPRSTPRPEHIDFLEAQAQRAEWAAAQAAAWAWLARQQLREALRDQVEDTLEAGREMRRREVERRRGQRGAETSNRDIASDCDWIRR